LGEHANLKKVTLSSTAVEKLPQQWQAPLEDLDMSQTSSLGRSRSIASIAKAVEHQRMRGVENLERVLKAARLLPNSTPTSAIS